MVRFALIAILSLTAGACSGDERPDPPEHSAVQPLVTSGGRWRFLDAFAALRSQDPARRRAAVEWIGTHLDAHPHLAREALQVAAADDAEEVASLARSLLRRLERLSP